MTDTELLSLAKEASFFAYTPYSNFKVGAALECSDGTVYTGCNVENSAYGESICAERTAVCKAVSCGHRFFTRIAIFGGSSDDFCTPCGSCRQVLSEFRSDIDVICGSSNGNFIKYRLSELLPHGFDLQKHSGAEKI